MNDGYKVIEIINEKELIIDFGSSNGANVGDKVRIYSIGEDVFHPDTDTVIGTLDIIKDELEVYTVYENFSICRKIARSKYNPILNPMANLNRTEVRSLDLNVDEGDISNRDLPSDPPPIKVGDSVIIL